MNKPVYLILAGFLLMPLTLQAQINSSIKPGMKSAELTALKGQPYYQTSNYSNTPDDQIWLFTKVQASKKVDEKKIMDQPTNWPTLYRKTIERSCQVGDVFVEVERGVVKNVIPANSKMSYGPCSITTTEEYLPIVDGKPAATPVRTTNNKVLEGAKP